MEPLEKVVANREWLSRRYPFPHIVASNVFCADFYTALASQLREMLDRQLGSASRQEQRLRAIPGYDAYGMGFQPTQQGPLGLFLTVGWRDLMTGLFGLETTPYVFAGAHYHAVGSQHGFIHNDFNPVWFPRTESDLIRTPDYALCHYKTGTGTLAGPQKVQVVRGAVMIFYLLNDGWRPGDGGETGLYDSPTAQVEQPATQYPPQNNSLVAFECTPDSFHSFVSNRRLPRISIIMWVHRPLSEATASYGSHRLEHWK